MGLLKDLNKKGTTIILIEQRTERVYSYATREIVLEKGRVAYDGEPKKNGKQPECSVKNAGDVLVSLDDVSFSYENNTVFENFSEKFKEGELVVLEGPNGSGKSTLLKIIMGLLKACSGVVNVGGLENPTVEETAGNVGYVFQNPDNHLFAETAGEEVEFILKNTGKRGNVDKTLKSLGILHYKNNYPRYLSGGEKQRVALASILVAEPKILLLDEPTRGMDHSLKKELSGYLLRYIGKGNLVVMATHDDYMASCATRRVRL
jgi:energy-coupling factor transporter ATP-binding protein EcfA2